MSQNISGDVSRRAFLAGHWRNKSDISPQCLNNQGVYCQACKDACDEGAIAFNQVQMGIQLPMIIPARCTNCRDCVESCPADAITIKYNDGGINDE